MALTECPKCGNVYDNKDQDGITDAGCPKCAIFSSPVRAEHETAASAPAPAEEKRPGYVVTPVAAPQRFTFDFTGNGGEYFKIWIVNLFLTVVTFGLYSAWAKVRTRKYFYSNMRLANGTFDYDGPPWAILRGRIIIGAIFVLFALSSRFEVFWLYYLLMALFFIALPFLIYKSLRFNLQHTLFRNIRFRFLGSLSESYAINLGYAILVPLTLGLIIPYIAYRKQRYYFGNIAFGNGLADFRGKAGAFYKYYIVAGVIMVVFSIAFTMVASIMTMDWTNLKSGGTGFNSARIMIIMLGMYGVFLVLFYMMKTFLFVKLTNYSLANTGLGNVTIGSTLRFWPLLFISVTNMLAILFTVGLLYPWTRIRYTRYCLDRISVSSPDGLNEFASVEAPEDTAIGEAAAEFFDFELGL